MVQQSMGCSKITSQFLKRNFFSISLHLLVTLETSFYEVAAAVADDAAAGNTAIASWPTAIATSVAVQ